LGGYVTTTDLVQCVLAKQNSMERLAPMTISISAQRITAAQIKDGRELLGWTQQKLAETADLSRQTVRRIERGEAGRRGSIEKAAHVLQSSGIKFAQEGDVAAR
jgi:DNA-binding XRE family transcriptional regulator